MKAIFTYKILDSFWKPKDDYFWKIAKLATDQARKFYPTVLYADVRTYEEFTKKGLEFDEFVDSTKLLDCVTEHTYGIAKMLVMMEQSSPYLMLDLDTVLFSKVSTDKHIAYGYKEVNVSTKKVIENKILEVKYLEEYYKRSYDIFKANHVLKFRDIDWDNYPSNSLLVVNSPKLIGEVSKKILGILDREVFEVPPIYTVQFYEQFLFYNLLREYDIETEFIYESAPGFDLDRKSELIDIFCFKFLHLDRYLDQRVKILVDSLEISL